MAAPPSQPPSKGGLSLYDNLTDPNDPSSSATISSAPVIYNQADGGASDPASAKKPINPAFRFQPIHRPQAKQTKPKAALPKVIPKITPVAAPAPQNETSDHADSIPAAGPPQAKTTTLADWAATEEDQWQYRTGEKRARGGRRKKKKKQHELFETDWNEIYDPARPTNVDEYLRSDEKVDEVREWKGLLYRHRKKPQDSDFSSDDEEPRPHMSNQFAPPPSFASVPPPPSSPPAAAPRPPPDDKSGEDAFARRIAMSQPQSHAGHVTLPPPPPEPTPSDSVTISRAPVRYEQPTPTDDPDKSYSPPPTLGLGATADATKEDGEDSRPRSMRPGQAGFANRLMAKYGWTKGSGLGADESGMVNPLRVQIEKRRKKADAEGGGWAEPGGKGKIIGGKRAGGNESKFGSMSEVIVLRNILEDMPDLATEIENGLGQEIGEECGEKYGRVERLYIHQKSRQVFIKFTDQVSALRAVNELDGRVFNGNAIEPKFYDPDRFDKGLYQ